MKKIIFVFWLAFSLLAVLPTFAQDDSTETHITILPDNLSSRIYTANVIPKGLLQFDIDYAFEHTYHPIGYRLTLGSLPQIKARYGLSKFIEARIGTRVAHFDHQRKYHDFHYRQTYLEIFTVGAKATLVSYNNAKGVFAIVGEGHVALMNLPFTSFTSSLSPTITLINENQLTNWLGYIANAGASFDISHSYQFPAFRARAEVYNFSATAIVYHRNHFNTFIGLNGSMYRYSETGSSLISGFLFSPNQNMQIRTSIGIGLKQSYYSYSPNLEGMLGMAWQPNFSRSK